VIWRPYFRERDAKRYFDVGAPAQLTWNTSHAMSIGTNIIIWPWIFIVRSSTVFPLGVWTDIICDVFASTVMGASDAAAVSRIRESLNIRIFTSLEDFFEYQAETITGNHKRDTSFRSGHHVALIRK
jgi:hypothetical protein